MSGIRVRTPAGVITFDSSVRTGRIIGYVDVSADGSLSNALLADGTPFSLCHRLAGTDGQQTPAVTFSGTTMTWTYPAGNKSNTRILYGVW